MSGVIGGKMKKIAAMLILVILSAACPVGADQQFIMKVGETMALPCLLEIWSDQSVSCVISNPEVLMSDGSGRAVIALSEGVSDVYIHMTNPDTDIRYTFVVEPVQTRNYPEEWTLPEDTDTDNADGVDDGPYVSDETDARDMRPTDGGNYAGDESHDSTSNVNGTVGIEEERADVAGTDPQEGEYTDERADSQTGALMQEHDPTDSPMDLHMPKEDESGAIDTAESVPFWEKRGRGGIAFEVIEENISAGTNAEGDLFDDRNAKYTPLAYLKSDGEVAPLFVCAAGREVRWKYLGRILFIEASAATAGPYRVGALDSRGNIYFFSS